LSPLKQAVKYINERAVTSTAAKHAAIGPQQVPLTLLLCGQFMFFVPAGMYS
jgi:hypothetical protein